MKLSPSLQKLVDAAERAMSSVRKKTKPKSHATIKRQGAKLRTDAERQLLEIRERRATAGAKKRAATIAKKRTAKKRTAKKRTIAKPARKPARDGFPAGSRRSKVAKKRTAKKKVAKKRPAKKRGATRLRGLDGELLRWTPIGGRRSVLYISNRHGSTVAKGFVEPSPSGGYEWDAETEEGDIKARGWERNPQSAKTLVEAAVRKHFRRYLK